ncbi:MAG: SsrA-binding protein SmpB [Pseudomonadota bacterium]
MAGKKNKAKSNSNTIATNRKARHDFHIEEHVEGGLVLEGWEVKSLRAGKAQLRDTYVLIENGEAWLHGAHIDPLPQASTHINPDPSRRRKVLLNRNEIGKFIGAIDRRGYTLVVLSLYWKNGRVKCDIGMAKGKKQHDKRATEKSRDWQREKARLVKTGGR